MILINASIKTEKKSYGNTKKSNSYITVNETNKTVKITDKRFKSLIKEVSKKLKSITIKDDFIDKKIKNNETGIHLIEFNNKPKAVIHISKKNGQPYKLRAYKVIANIGSGKYADVYEVQNVFDQKTYALKVGMDLSTEDRDGTDPGEKFTPCC